jgi:DNA-binding NtrC family response regulator
MNVRTPAEIVIVDDESAARESYTLLLRHWFPHVSIHAFGDGRAGWKHLMQTDPDLLVMDLNRHGMNGLATLRGLAARNAAYPILVISGCYDDAIKELAETAAHSLRVHFLSKPASMEQIHRALVELLPTAP